jgi:exo-beta-1,3-glucanase (GH17 family)
MKFTAFNTPSIRQSSLFWTLIAILFSLTLASCGGGGFAPADPLSLKDGGQLRSLSADFTKRKAIAYSPYRAKTEADKKTEEVTDENIKQDLNLLFHAKFGLIRLYDSSALSEQILKVIKTNNFDIKVMLGAHISTVDLDNQTEIVNCIKLAKAYSDIILAVSVGNETMMKNSPNPQTPEVMVAYLNKVKTEITQPITTDDNWSFFAGVPLRNLDPQGNSSRLVLAAIDFVSMHSYPLWDAVYDDTQTASSWDWRQKNVPIASRATAMMGAAIESIKSDYTILRTYLDSKGFNNKPIIIGETGWKADNFEFMASPVNQKMYFDGLMAWAEEGRTGSGPKAVFYFAAFDEPWKQAANDDNWGLFNSDRQARFAIQSFNFPDYQTEPVIKTDAVYWIKPVILALDATRYTLSSDIGTTGESRAYDDKNLGWFPWTNNEEHLPTVVVAKSEDSTPDYAPYLLKLSPEPAYWGWGMFFGSDLQRVSSNLSNFATKGHLNFDIKTTYPGKLEVGFKTIVGDYDVSIPLLQLSSGSHGYSNTGSWSHVKIPLADIKSTADDLSMVLHRLIIADRFGVTNNAACLKKNGCSLPSIYLDNIYISKD